jgi:foldase protein PrsA
MTFAMKPALLVATSAIAAAAVVGCGNDVPANSVAKIGDTTVTKKEFDRWVKSAATGQAQGGQGAVPDPPDYKSCIAGLKKQAQPQGSGKQPDSQLKKVCEQNYDRIKDEVMQFLITSKWVEQEAEAQNVSVSDREIENTLAEEKKRSFPGKKGEQEYQKFLKTSGLDEAAIKYRLKGSLLQQKLQTKITKKAGQITDADVRSYYAKNKKRFGKPEQRDIRVVLTKTKAKADQAKSRLAGGESFDAVAKAMSTDDATKKRGGKLSNVTEGSQDKALDKEVFAAKRGVLEGPVKTQFGYYLFEVDGITKGTQQSLKQSEEAIRSAIRSEREQKVMEEFVKDFRERYRKKTECADGYEIAECNNAPKESTDTSGAAPGGAPQGAPQEAPQGAPQGGAPQAPQGGAPQAPQGAPQGGAPQAPQQAPASP